jgi:predicted hotdog family 3-hydroxylacyl-ACP dehydratase
MPPSYLDELTPLRNCAQTVSELLPHAAPMVLLDRVLGWDQGVVKTALTVRDGIPFFEQGYGVPAYVGLEYMAQACGVYAGIEGLEHGRPVRLGFLLGTRNYHSGVDWFEPGSELIVDAVEVFRQDLMGVFDCRVSHNDNELASARLNLYQPHDAGSVYAPSAED